MPLTWHYHFSNDCTGRWCHPIIKSLPLLCYEALNCFNSVHYNECESRPQRSQKIQSKRIVLVPQRLLILHSPVKTDDTEPCLLALDENFLDVEILIYFNGEEVGGAPGRIIYQGSYSSNVRVSSSSFPSAPGSKRCI